MDSTVADIIHGIRYSVEHIDKSHKADLDEDDFNLDAKSEYTILRPGTKRPYTFKDYAPHVFAKIRELLGESPKKFLNSWHVTADAELAPSTARSGSMFYKTPDEKFFFKTILHPEVSVMMDLLKDYYHHMRTHSRSFMVRIYGMFRHTQVRVSQCAIPLTPQGTTKTWILIMGNAFPPSVKLAHIFDLKGRPAKPGKSVQERGVISTSVYKDNEITRKLLFHSKDKEHYLTQLNLDVGLLRDHNIMDYSLLVGVHKLTPEEIEEEKSRKKLFRKSHEKEVKSPRKGKEKKRKDKEKNREKRASKVDDVKLSIFDYGGLRAVSPDDQSEEIVFLSIIDNLTYYAFGKQLAHFFKKFLWDSDTLSTVRSEFYANRFLRFMTKNLLADEVSVVIDPDESASFEKELADMSKDEVDAIKQRQAERKRERKRRQRHGVDDKGADKTKSDRNERAESLQTARQVRTDYHPRKPRKLSASSGPRTQRNSSGELPVVTEEKPKQNEKLEERKKPVNRSKSSAERESASEDDKRSRAVAAMTSPRSKSKDNRGGSKNSPSRARNTKRSTTTKEDGEKAHHQKSASPNKHRSTERVDARSHGGAKDSHKEKDAKKASSADRELKTEKKEKGEGLATSRKSSDKISENTKKKSENGASKESLQPPKEAPPPYDGIVRRKSSVTITVTSTENLTKTLESSG